MNILLAAATEGEVGPTIAWLREHAVETDKNTFTFGRLSLHICLTGVGIMAATESLTRVLLTSSYDFALQAGVAGTSDRAIPLAEVVQVESETPADLGAEDRDGSFLDIYTLGLSGKNDVPFQNGKLPANAPEHLPGTAFTELRSVTGLTVQTVSGTEQTIASRVARYGAEVETMEGAPLHYCCLKAGVPFLQIRALSNYVEPRNRAAWKMIEAITSLNKVLTSWLAELAALPTTQ